MAREQNISSRSTKPKLEIVLKCGSIGCVEAATSAITKIPSPDVDIIIIQSGVGTIRRSDIVMAETGSGLIVGFEVDVLPGVDRELRKRGVEVRLYEVIYRLIEDIQEIVENFIPLISPEKITGTARIIALFPGSRKGIIIGCEVLSGFLARGERFRIISAMGPVYTGKIGSIHIEKNEVQKATPGQRCGIKIRDFNKTKIGDLVESFRPLPSKKSGTWHPTGGIVRIS